MDFTTTMPINAALSLPTLLQPLLIALESHGVCPQQALRDTGIALEKIDQTENGFFKAQIRLLEYGCHLSGDPMFAARASRFFKFEHLGILGLLLKSASNGEISNDAFMDLLPALPKPFPNIILNPMEKRAEIDIAWGEKDKDESIPLLTEYIFGCILFCIPLIAGCPAHPKYVSFTHSSRALSAEYEQIFGCPVVFNSESNSCIAIINSRNSHKYHNETLFNELKLLFSRLLRSRENEGYTDIRSLIISELITQRPNERDIAKRLSISESTLRRHLSARGTTFQQELDNTMREIATQLLNEESMDIKAVAARLQYSDPSAFHRAFKRWTGLTPTQYLRGYRQ